MKTSRPFHFHPGAVPARSSRAVRFARVHRTPVGSRPRALQSLAVLGEPVARPLAARWAMIRVTASRQEWSSLRTWERKP